MVPAARLHNPMQDGVTDPPVSTSAITHAGQVGTTLYAISAVVTQVANFPRQAARPATQIGSSIFEAQVLPGFDQVGQG